MADTAWGSQSYEVYANRGITLPDQCTTCYAGWYFAEDSNGNTPATGECKACHPSCAACTGPAETECLYCYDERIFNDATKKCDCKDGTLTDNTYWCFGGDCPAGTWKDSASNYCVDGNESAQVSENPINKGPAASQLGTRGYSTEPNSTGYDGFSFFNGYSSSLFGEDIRLHYDGPDFHVIFRPLTLGGVIFSARDVEFITNYDYDNKTRRHYDPILSYVGIIELRITDCGKLQFIMGDSVW
jgi:hypothetical protein